MFNDQSIFLVPYHQCLVNNLDRRTHICLKVKYSRSRLLLIMTGKGFLAARSRDFLVFQTGFGNCHIDVWERIFVQFCKLRLEKFHE